MRSQVRTRGARSKHGPFLGAFGLDGSEVAVVGATIFTTDEDGLEKKAIVAVNVVDGRQRVPRPLDKLRRTRRPRIIIIDKV